MSWVAIETRLVEDLVEVHGEAIALPGAQTVYGVFEPLGQPGLRLGELDGMDARLMQQPQPVLWLSTGDGAALVDGDRVTARGAEYLVSRIDPDGAGMLRVELQVAPGY